MTSFFNSFIKTRLATNNSKKWLNTLRIIIWIKNTKEKHRLQQIKYKEQKIFLSLLLDFTFGTAITVILKLSN